MSYAIVSAVLKTSIELGSIPQFHTHNDAIASFVLWSCDKKDVIAIT